MTNAEAMVLAFATIAFAIIAAVAWLIRLVMEHPLLSTAIGSTVIVGWTWFVLDRRRTRELQARRQREIRAHYARVREERLRALTLDDVDRMTGNEFEEYVARLLRHHGYEVHRTGRAGDQGCDLLLTFNGARIVCQTKRYSQPVSNSAVQEAVAAKAVYACQAAMVVTSARFTKGARDLASMNKCELLDRRDLGELAANFRAGVSRRERRIGPPSAAEEPPPLPSPPLAPLTPVARRFDASRSDVATSPPPRRGKPVGVRVLALGVFLLALLVAYATWRLFSPDTTDAGATTDDATVETRDSK